MIRMSESERKRIKESFRGKGVLLDLLLEKCVVSCASGNAVPAIYGFRLESPRKEEKLFYYVTNSLLKLLHIHFYACFLFCC